MKQLRAQVADVSRILWERGWVANHDGNVTARGEGNRFIATPTATSKRLVTERTLIEVDAKGQVHGAGKVFGEIGLHLVVYERRRDVHCVVHAHPPNATAIASVAAPNPIDRPFIAEALVSLGPKIPRIPYAQPGDAAKHALAPWCELVDAVILGNHGVIAWGADPEQALLRLELVEHLAKIAVAATPLGGVQPLPDSAIAPLLAARAKANIGHAANRAVETAAQLMGSHASAAPSMGSPQSASTGVSPKAVVACAPAPDATVPTMSPGGTPHALSDIVREEIVRALRR
ncbi:MAG: class II aldolase/adducin family protein [Kofleriaceae bacterium]